MKHKPGETNAQRIRTEIQRKADTFDSLSEEHQELFKDIRGIPESCRRRQDIIDNKIYIYGERKTHSSERAGIDIWEKYLLFYYEIKDTVITPGHKITDPADGSIIKCYRIEAEIPRGIDVNAARNWESENMRGATQ